MFRHLIVCKDAVPLGTRADQLHDGCVIENRIALGVPRDLARALKQLFGWLLGYGRSPDSTESVGISYGRFDRPNDPGTGLMIGNRFTGISNKVVRARP